MQNAAADRWGDHLKAAHGGEDCPALHEARGPRAGCLAQRGRLLLPPRRQDEGGLPGGHQRVIRVGEKFCPLFLTEENTFLYIIKNRQVCLISYLNSPILCEKVSHET